MYLSNNPFAFSTLNIAEFSSMGSRPQKKFSQRITKIIEKVMISLARRHPYHPISLEYPGDFPPPSPCYSESSTLMDDHFEGSLISLVKKHGSGKATNGGQCTYALARLPAPTVDWCDVAQTIIDMLPNNALLEIFDFYVDGARIEAWITLVHVSRKWRNVVFGAPHRLNLRLDCRARTPVRETLHVWPPLPIVILGNDNQEWGVDNIIAALEHNDRVCGVELWHIRSSQMDKLLAAMQEPFPALTYLDLVSKDKTARVVPDSFLGGSAPRLRSLSLDRIPFPSLPRLLLSATDLVNLSLCGIPLSGYISPEAMVAGLSTLTRLKSLWLEFQSPLWENGRPPPPTRARLPALTHFEFKGICEYLEDLVARIDTPLLDDLNITFFDQFIFDTPHLAQFISRTPKFDAPDEAYLKFSHLDVSVTLPRGGTFDGTLHFAISCTDSLWQLSSLTQVCTTPLCQALIPAVERLYILDAEFLRTCWQDDIKEEESSQWLELLRPFTAVNDLYLYREFVPYFAATIQELGAENIAELLPALRRIFLEDPWLSGSVKEIIKQFVALQRLSGDRIVVSLWSTGREKYKWYEIVDW
jgi:hypothetical protein